MKITKDYLKKLIKEEIAAMDDDDKGDVDFEHTTKGIKSLIASRIVAENYPVEPDEYRGDEEREITKFSLSEDENLREFLIFALEGLVKELKKNELKSFPSAY